MPRNWLLSGALGGSFACAIGANHTQALAGGNIKRQVVDDCGVAIAFVQVLCAKKWGWHTGHCAAEAFHPHQKKCLPYSLH